MHCLIHTQIYIGLKIVNALSHTHTQTYIGLKTVNAMPLSHTHTYTHTDLHWIKNSKCIVSRTHP